MLQDVVATSERRTAQVAYVLLFADVVRRYFGKLLRLRGGFGAGFRRRQMVLDVSAHGRFAGESRTAHIAAVRFLARVNTFVTNQMLATQERQRAFVAFVRLFPAMYFQVLL